MSSVMPGWAKARTPNARLAIPLTRIVNHMAVQKLRIPVFAIIPACP
jgi:hypothetical protein